MENEKQNVDQEHRASSDHERYKEVTEAGDIGDEQMPAGEIKTDKRVWNYTADKIMEKDLPKKIKRFVAGL